jgi:hypothetical protein
VAVFPGWLVARSPSRTGEAAQIALRHVDGGRRDPAVSLVRIPMLRHAGFGLLGLATVKVFVIDLAAMDVAYRALVLAGLGLLLLLSAYLFTHFRGPRSGAPGISGGPHPAA